MKLFDRAIRIQVQTKLLEGLDVEFRVDRSLRENPNTADLTIYNLSDENRAFLQTVQRPIVKISAGYRGDDPTDPDSRQPSQDTGTDPEPPLIFLGEMREVTNLREGPNWLTRITTGDGDEALRAPIRFSLGPDSSILNTIKKLVADAGANPGNLFQVLERSTQAAQQFLKGAVVHGDAKTELKRLLNSVGVDFSMQNGQIQALPTGQPVNNTAVLLSDGTGLVNSPELGLDKKTKKPVLKFRALLNAKIYPGSKVKVESDSVSGFYRVERAVYHGQTFGQEWYVDCESTAL